MHSIGIGRLVIPCRDKTEMDFWEKQLKSWFRISKRCYDGFELIGLRI